MRDILRLGALCALFLSGCCAGTVRRQSAIDEGYRLGASDAIKRHYWMKQALERQGETVDKNSRTVYYTFEEEEITKDGRKLTPRKKTISIVE